MTTIGILLDQHIYRKIPFGVTGTEKLSLYNKAADRLGLTLLYISLADMTLSQGKVIGYLYKDNRYIETIRPVPKVIHNRTFSKNIYEQKYLTALGKLSHVFNELNRYPKYYIHSLLWRHARNRSFLPPSRSYSPSSLHKMMKKYKTLYIKPQEGSVGRGIIRIQRLKVGQWSFQTSTNASKLNSSEIQKQIHQHVGQQSYMIQQGIDLATYRDKPYDIRVSVQRGRKGAWRLTGMVGKIAHKGSHVTNVARGGSVKKCGLLFRHSQLPVHLTRKRIAKVSLYIAAYLGRRLKHLADVGLDIGVSKSGNPYFIEMNCRDQRYSFDKAGLTKTFYRSYARPLRYAAFLARRRPS